MDIVKLNKAFSLFDAYNRRDPTVFKIDGHVEPSTYFYTVKLYDWVKKLDPEASEALLLASRSQHIGRWEVPRSTYPEGRVGYLQWRSDLSKFHAQKAADILNIVGYDEDTIDRVQMIILKRKLKIDAEVQTMEDALCLVFLEFQYDELIAKHADEKIIHILRKTWNKMTDRGRKAALTLDFSEKGTFLLGKALDNSSH